MNSNKIPTIIAGALLLVLTINLISAIIVDADYITLYPGEEGRVTLNVENNENFDIEDVSVAIDLSKFRSHLSAVRRRILMILMKMMMTL